MMYNTMGKKTNGDIKNLDLSHEDYKQDTIDEAEPQFIVGSDKKDEATIYKELNRNTKGKLSSRNNSVAFA